MKIKFGIVYGLLLLLMLILLVRLISLGLYPLMDTTEARYGEMARKILETHNWLTPQYDYGVPFWGKPPFSFWASAVTMATFGINEFGARFAPFLASILTGLLFFAWPYSSEASQNKKKALGSFIIAASSAIGFVSAGAVMTDEFLLLSVTLVMVSFWKAMTEANCNFIWKYAFFIGLSLGLLSKGPLVLVLAGFPIFIWTLAGRQWLNVWKRLPWINGTILMLILTLPWYLAAEKATPGFLRYFIIGEHFERFVVSGWKGDLYGSGHARPLGMIWLFGLASFLPWSLILPFLVRKSSIAPAADNQKLYLLMWTFTPLLFFTFAKNILPAYVLPGLGGLAILSSNLIFNWHNGKSWKIWLIPTALFSLMAVVMVYPGISSFTHRHQKDILQNWDKSSELVYIDRRPYSAQFYTKGNAKLVKNLSDIQKLTSQKQRQTLIMRNSYEEVHQGLFKGYTRHPQEGGWVMLRNF